MLMTVGEMAVQFIVIEMLDVSVCVCVSGLGSKNKICQIDAWYRSTGLCFTSYLHRFKVIINANM